MRYCRECGAAIGDESPFCRVCGAINILSVDDAEYWSDYTNDNHTDSAFSKDEQSMYEALQTGESFLKTGDFSSACQVFEEITKEFPESHLAWWGLLRAATNDFQDTLIDQKLYEEIQKYYNIALNTCKDPSEIAKTFSDYKCRVMVAVSQTQLEIRNQIAEEENKQMELQAQLTPLYAKINDINRQIQQVEGKDKSEKWLKLKMFLRILFPVLGLIYAIIDGWPHRTIDIVLNALLLVPIGFGVGWLVGLPFGLIYNHDPFRRIEDRQKSAKIDLFRDEILHTNAKMQPILDEIEKSKTREKQLNDSINSYANIQ